MILEKKQHGRCLPLPVADLELVLQIGYDSCRSKSHDLLAIRGTVHD